MTMIVPTAPGGINDISGRLVARHMGRFIPGNPSFVVQNQPGGGGLVAANRLANTAERDGSIISIIQRGIVQVAAEGNPNVKFVPEELTWLGSLSDYSNDAYLLVVNAKHPAKTAADLKNGVTVLRLGGNQPGSTNLAFAYIAKNVLGLNVEVVRGYRGAAPMFLAMQSGEIDGQVIGYDSVRAGQASLWQGKQLRPLVQFARNKRHPELADVPTGRELVADPQMRRLLEYAELPFEMALPLLAPPKLPADRAEALKAAFMKMTGDQNFLSDAKKVGVEVTAIDGAAVQRIVSQTMRTPKEIIALNAKLATPRD
jgi:tripartite-type tricarboxylate transporter receptor subunit TctC